VVLDAFGPSRVMFGSDWPVCLLRRSYSSVLALAQSLTAGLSQAERTKVLGGTAARVYGLGASLKEQPARAAPPERAGLRRPRPR
jgi:L-fuconolactonase